MIRKHHDEDQTTLTSDHSISGQPTSCSLSWWYTVHPNNLECSDRSH